MKHRTKFIQENAIELRRAWLEDDNLTHGEHTSIVRYLEKAIELGMNNADLEDEDYTYSISDSPCRKYRFSILKNDYCMMQSGYIFSDYLLAENAARAVIHNLE